MSEVQDLLPPAVWTPQKAPLMNLLLPVLNKRRTHYGVVDFMLICKYRIVDYTHKSYILCPLSHCVLASVIQPTQLIMSRQQSVNMNERESLEQQSQFDMLGKDSYCLSLREVDERFIQLLCMCAKCAAHARRNFTRLSNLIGDVVCYIRT